MNVPVFSLPASDGKTYTEKDFKDKKIILYLYPKDMTPGCTLEAQTFRDFQEEFTALGFEIFGVSMDLIHTHQKFCEEQNLKFPLLSDKEGVLIKGLDSWVEKTMYGKTYMGIDRSTFIIKNQEITHEWRNVSAKSHVEAVLAFCKKEA